MLGSTIIIKRRPTSGQVKLSLVALMDIFTILVFFLLLNSGDSQTLEDAKFVKLPDSNSETSPHSDLVIHVGTNELWIDDEKVADIQDIALNQDKPILPLAEVLNRYIGKHGEMNPHESENGFSVTIMADKAVPYAVLKAVMATCSGQNFRDISLAVNRVASETFGPGEAIAPPTDSTTASPDAEQAL